MMKSSVLRLGSSFTANHTKEGAVKDFHDWIEDACGVKACIETARSYLQSLGFTQKSHHKAVYFDGHERDDENDLALLIVEG